MKLKTKPEIEFFRIDVKTDLSLQFIPYGVSAGFPSPADDYLEEQIDLNKELIKNPISTFLARIKGDSMIEDGIDDGDIAIIDRSLPFAHGLRVLAYVDNGFTIKRLNTQNGQILLEPSNSKYCPIEIAADDAAQIWGVVIWVIKKFG